MSFINFVKSDLYRYKGRTSGFFSLFLVNRGFRLLCWHRLGNSISFKPLKSIISVYYQHLQNKYSIDLPLSVKLGHGIYIGHTFAIAISKECVIGRNVNISQCVTIGKKHTGNRNGVPILGNNIYIGPGTVIIGGIVIGDNVVIGANSVITKDIPDNAVVAGVPAKILSYSGSEKIVNNRWKAQSSN